MNEIGGFGTEAAQGPGQEGQKNMSAAIQSEVIEEPLAITLAELLDVIAEITPDEDEIVATMLHMVETRRVRLITPPTAF